MEDSWFMRIFLRPSALLRLAAITSTLLMTMPAAYSADSPLAESLKATYPLTKVGIQLLRFDYNRITAPGIILTVRAPGIYADLAGTQAAIITTNVERGQVSQQKGILAALNDTQQSRTLDPGEQVYVTQISAKRDSVRMELLTVKVTSYLGWGTRYRSELNFKIPDLESKKPEEIKNIIDSIVAEASIADAVQSKTIKLGMNAEEVKKALGNPEKIVDLGSKQIYVYKDMKVILKDSQVADVE